MDLPGAEVCHRTANRLRLKIASRRKDTAYFDDASSQLSGLGNVEKLEANPVTGSILFVGQSINEQAIADFARSKGLFHLTDEKTAETVAHTFLDPFAGLSASIEGMTGGHANLASLIFLMFVAFGIYDLLKGDFKTPPWYTAFWYAFGIFTLSLLRKADSIK